MRHALLRLLLTEKRLFKKISYILVLLMMPLLIAGLSHKADEEAGIIRIGIYSEGGEESLSRRVADGFLQEESILRYIRYDSEEDAVSALSESSIDAVWIFPSDMEERLSQLAEKERIGAIVRVIEREDDVALVFTREVLCSRIFPLFIYDTYTEFIRENLGDDVSEEELRSLYDSLLWTGNLFHGDGSESAETETGGYLLAPMRGVIAIWMVLAGMAALLYYRYDIRNGLYDAVPAGKRILHSFGLQAVVLTNCGVMGLCAFRILGIMTDPLKEILSMGLYIICISVFCNLLGFLSDSMEAIGVMIPFVIIVMIVLCPVFIDLRQFAMIRTFLPAAQYLAAVYGQKSLLHMCIYALLGGALCIPANLIRNRT
ncbi:MAG: ABC transporter permease [Lachnospiraceae bacterium]|nr:ABC transporter permease [Lachnospiraceae bacterium]